MKTQLTVPTGFVSYLRGGLFGEWGYAAERLSNLALEFGGNAPEGAYLTPLHTFFVTYALLSEVGLRENDAKGDVALDLSVGGVYVVNGLRGEHRTLVEQLDEMPKKTRKAMRDAASAKVAKFGEFVTTLEAQVKSLATRSSPITHPLNRPPIHAQPSRVRRSQH